MTLQEIGLKHGTDKASHHFYLPLYELLFREWPNAPRILEIGIQFGNSLRTWAEYWPYGQIVGIDSVDNGVELPNNTSEIIIGDAYSLPMFERLKNWSFDIIIDDGSHLPTDQGLVCACYSELLSPCGLLIIEDVLEADTIPKLASALPEGFEFTAVEMTLGRSMVDSRLFIAWRNN